MSKIAITIGGNETAFINQPSDFEAMKDQLINDGIDAEVIKIKPQSIKDWAKDQAASSAEFYRSKLASASAGKIAEYRIKEGLAADPDNNHAKALAVTAGLDPDNAAAKELALIAREATARSFTTSELTTTQAKMALAYRQVALLIGALEAEAGAAIAAIPDDAENIEVQIAAVLQGAKTQAEAAFEKAVALIKGG